MISREQKLDKIVDKIVAVEYRIREKRKLADQLFHAMQPMRKLYERYQKELENLEYTVHMLEDKAGEVEEEVREIEKEMEELDNKWCDKTFNDETIPNKRTGKVGRIKSKRGSR